jgi:hypothetical protein
MERPVARPAVLFVSACEFLGTTRAVQLTAPMSRGYNRSR